MSDTPAALARAERGLGIFAGLLAAAGGVALFILAIVTVVSVFWRYVLRDPIFGIEDVSTMAMTVLVAGSIAYGATQGSHVSVNVIKMFAGRPTTRLTDILARVLGIGICGFATYGLFTKGSCGLPCGAITSNLGISHVPFYYVLGTAMGFYTVLLFVHLLIGLAHWAGEDPNEAID